MTENKGDLISREALRKAIEQGEGISWDSYGKDDLCVRKKYIDNAPTVEIPVARWDCYCEGQKVGYEKALSERPQGEWVEAEITEEYRQYGFDLRVVCSRCGSEQSYFDFNEYHEPIAVTYIRSRFCSYCGAKMIKDFTGEAIP